MRSLKSSFMHSLPTNHCFRAQFPSIRDSAGLVPNESSRLRLWVFLTQPSMVIRHHWNVISFWPLLSGQQVWNLIQPGQLYCLGRLHTCSGLAVCREFVCVSCLASILPWLTLSATDQMVNGGLCLAKSMNGRRPQWPLRIVIISLTGAYTDMVGVHSLPSAYTCLLGEASSTGVCNRTLTRFGSAENQRDRKIPKTTVFESVLDVVVELLSEFPLLNKRAFSMRAYFLPTNAAVSRACFRVC